MKTSIIRTIMLRGLEHWSKHIGFGNRIKIQALQCAKYVPKIGDVKSLESKIVALQKGPDRLSPEVLERVFASSPSAITISDLKGNIIACNQATLDLHGFSSEKELLGRSAFELISPRDHQKAMMNLQTTLVKRVVKDIEYTFITVDGREFQAEFSASVIRDASGRPIAFVMITRDITERKQAEIAELQQREMEAAVLAINGLVHALSQKFTGLLGYVSLLQISPEDKKLYAEAGKVSKEIERYFGKFNFFRYRISRNETVDLRTFAGNIFKSVKDKFSDLSAQTTIYISEDLGETKTSSAALSVILESILNNAFEAIEKGGNVALSLRKASMGKKQAFEIVVTDDGKGIEPEVQVKMFRPFFSTDPDAVASQKGLSLGLVGFAVDKLGGSIEVQSKPGKGTEVKILLPLEEE